MSAEPPPGVIQGVERLLRRTGRFDASWAQTAEMMVARELTVRRRVSRLADHKEIRWVQMGSEFGRPVRNFVTYDDMTVPLAMAMEGYVKLRPTVARGWVRRQAGIYRAATGCCVASRWQAGSLVSDFGVPPERIQVVGFGYNVQIAAAPRDWSQPRFLFVGLDWSRKNGARVLSAFQRIREVIPAAHLDLVGDHPPVTAEGVTGHGVLDWSVPAQGAALSALFQSATCFVLPSRYEPFGIVYVEAGLAGLPSVATAVGGARDAVGDDGGLFVDPNDLEGLVAAMLQLADPARAQQMGVRAAVHAARLSWVHVAERVAASLVEPGSVPPLVDLV